MESWQHQKDGVQFCKDKKAALLYWGMGAGKTRCTIDLMKEIDAKMILIACPKKVIMTWENQFEEHAPGEFLVFAPSKGTVKKKASDINRFLAIQPHKKKVIIINYESAWRPGLGTIKDQSGNIIDPGMLIGEVTKKLVNGRTRKKVEFKTWDLVVVDESQKIKANNSKVSKFFHKLGTRAKKKLALSGTPAPNSPLDIFGTYRFLDQDIFGKSFHRFKMRYAEWGGFENREVLSFINQKEMNQRIYSIAHRIRTEDVVELPDCTHQTIECRLSPKAQKVYNEFMKEAIITFQDGNELTASNVLVKYLRLAQIASGTIITDEGVEKLIDTTKLDALKTLLLGIDEPVVIFTRFRAEVKQIKEMIQGFKKSGERERVVAELTGAKDERMKFASGEAEIIIVNIAAGGVGVNELVRARFGIYFSTGYSSGDYDQSLARIRRPGSNVNKKVHYYHIVAKNTIDEKIRQAIEKKMDIIEAIIAVFGGRPLKKSA